MKKITLILICLLFITQFSAWAGKEKKYAVNTIDEALLKNANSIVRLDEKKYTVIDENKIKLQRKCAITIFNSNAESEASFFIVYDRFRDVKGIEARVYDGDGEEIRKMKSSEITDINMAAGQSASLDDGRVKYYEAKISTFPYTFEFEYELDYSTTLFYPDWQPVSNYEQSIEIDNFSITVPEGIEFDYLESNSPSVQITEVKEGTNYSWCLQDFAAIKSEPHSPPMSEFTPYVYTRAKTFVMDGYIGSLESWSTFGEWVAELNKGRTELSEETVEELNNMVASCSSNEEKIQIIYEYLQSKTRYVSIQLGVGGWQTAPANEVDEKGYGDCKALTNYTQAMLQAVGIDSYYTVIKAGSGAKSINPAFPKSQFNHAILMVPNEKDTIWLECTSQRNPFKYLGTFTGNRVALVVDGKNSQLVETTKYTSDNNRIENEGEFKLLANGGADVSIISSHKGIRYDDLRKFYFEGKEEQEKFLYDEIELNDFKINGYSYSQKKGTYPEAELKLNLNVKQYSTVMNDRLFVPVNSYNQSTYIPKRVRNRKTEVVKINAHSEKDEFKFVIPEGYEIESVPEDCNVECEFGAYKTSSKQEINKVVFSRELVVNNGRFPKESYTEFINFYKAVAKGDKAKLVLKKKAGS